MVGVEQRHAVELEAVGQELRSLRHQLRPQSSAVLGVVRRPPVPGTTVPGSPEIRVASKVVSRRATRRHLVALVVQRGQSGPPVGSVRSWRNARPVSGSVPSTWRSVARRARLVQIVVRRGGDQHERGSSGTVGQGSGSKSRNCCTPAGRARSVTYLTEGSTESTSRLRDQSSYPSLPASRTSRPCHRHRIQHRTSSSARICVANGSSPPPAATSSVAHDWRRPASAESADDVGRRCPRGRRDEVAAVARVVR